MTNRSMPVATDRQPDPGASVMVRVTDVDSHCAQARRAGARFVVLGGRS